MPFKKHLLGATLALLATSSAFAQEGKPVIEANPDAPMLEMAFRLECDTISKDLVRGFLAARNGLPAPVSEAGAAGFSLPAESDVAAQANLVKRQCIKANVGTTDANWAAAELMAQSKVLKKAAFRCIASGFTYEKDTAEAELELAGCHRPEYPGLPTSVGGHAWSISRVDTPNGLALELAGRIEGELSGAVCTRINDFKRSSDDPRCQVRDSYSVVTSQFLLETAKDPNDMVNDIMRKMVEDYKKQQQEKPTPAL